eukprot:scaffold36696_cov56-Phaeocystis_antarctica.AAC.2
MSPEGHCTTTGPAPNGYWMRTWAEAVPSRSTRCRMRSQDVAGSCARARRRYRATDSPKSLCKFGRSFLDRSGRQPARARGRLNSKVDNLNIATYHDVTHVDITPCWSRDHFSYLIQGAVT